MRYFIEITYKGSDYHGWQYQPNALTVQEVLNNTFKNILRHEVRIIGAGRTDTGVHADQMYAHFDTDCAIVSDSMFRYKINAALPNDIFIKDIFKVHKNAHARFSASCRSYEYRIYCGRNPFLLETSWQIFHQELNIQKMNEAAGLLIGNQDFKCFSRTGSDIKHHHCEVTQSRWVKEGHHLIFYISANRFLRNMVRAIVGTLVDVGKHRLSPKDLIEIIKSKDRSMASASAPARGLFLTKITYPKDLVHD